ncbi:trehalose-6-phosphate synthase [Sulfitobacter aestuarii]|uniref:Trehalose-6-phosphate synthase n=1 Tax=Sulfitobacter aestuarii TaxID=2161676 RepID=A0ABW5U279_9RHOB
MAGRLILVSNRMPTEAQTSGGLVVALQGALHDGNGLWIGAHPDFAEKPSEQLIDMDKGREGMRYARLAFQLSRQEHEDYYLGFANSVLWPLCHRRGDLVSLEREFETAYLEVNARLARQIAELARPDDMIWIHDYHFFPLAEKLRALGVTAKIGFFLHIPFPALGDLGALPQRIDFPGWLSAFDLVGLQTRADVARCLEMFRAEPDAELMLNGRVKYLDRAVALRSFPIGIEVEAFVEAAGGDDLRNVLGTDMPGDILIGVDRLDYSKGLPNRFRAFGRYLERRRQTCRRVSLLQIAPPTREEVPAYRQIRLELEELAGRLNGQHAELDWTPLRYIHRAIDRNLLAQLYRRARAGLVTPFADGMNLVAKEYIAAQDPEDPGVLILSRMAGAAEDMEEALLVNPYDIEEISEAIRTALNMPLPERQRRYEACMHTVRETDVTRWSADFLATLQNLTDKVTKH